MPNKSSSSTFGRRTFLGGVSALIASSALARDYGPHAAPIHYPDPDIMVLDKRFAKYKVGNASIERLHTGMRWTEGPAWSGAGQYLVWSDIPNDEQLRRIEAIEGIYNVRVVRF